MPKDFNLRLYKLQENYIQKVSEKGLTSTLLHPI